MGFIRRNKDLVIESDKTYNYYRVSKEEYRKLLLDEVSKDYKKTEGSKITNINQEASQIAGKMDLDDRIMKIKSRDAFCSLKDHKDNFRSSPSIRLINPSCQDIGQASRIVLKNAVLHIRRKLSINLWENTYQMLEWLTVQQRRNVDLCFIQMDVVGMYPNIKRKLLCQPLFSNTSS